MSEDTHQCPAPGCTIEMARNLFACPNHWYSLPQHLRSAVNTAWRRVSRDPSSIEEYLGIREEAVQWLTDHAST